MCIRTFTYSLPAPSDAQLLLLFLDCCLSSSTGCQTIGCNLQNCTFVPWLESLLGINCFLDPSPSGRRDTILAPLFQEGCTNQTTCRRGALALLGLHKAFVLAGPHLCCHPWGYNIELLLYLPVCSHCSKPFMGFPATLLALVCHPVSPKSLPIQKLKG